MRLPDHLVRSVELAKRTELLLAGRIVKPVPIVAAAEQEIAVRQHDEIVLVFVRAETQHQKVVGGRDEMLVAAADIEDVQRA